MPINQSVHPFLWKIAKVIEEKGGDVWFFDMIADGKKMKQIADLVGCSRPTLYAWIKSEPDRKQALVDARALSAHSIIEDLDTTMESRRVRGPVEAQLLNTRARFNQWRASKLNKEDFGDDHGPKVQINIGSLHTEALRARVIQPKQPLQLGAGE